ncbi:FAD binding domain-containing protein [Cordyceps javanica]|uniref:FAD binding domain-containing protein n=1 Tax=Cordyceps javanica TaxID=43265 RepID=A0A545USV8_9HYPO|nr:FAD binding domain-containing protein [Cordyceps javanica]TQW04225.1 FAD binding domain protein [Cordyceps javanica]
MGPIKETYVDVLIIGAGPAGLMMAVWMAKCGISTRIVDKRGTKVFSGQADGLQCRTLEIMDSLGFGHRAWRESNHMLEFCMWSPDEAGRLRRSDRIADTTPGLSRFQQAVLQQGRIERFFLDEMAECSDIRVERAVMPTSLTIDEAVVEDPDSYPIVVALRHLTEEEATPKHTTAAANGQPVHDGLFRSNLTKDDTAEMLALSKLNEHAGAEQIVHAKYVVGADGAHSWTRRQIGLSLEGDSTDYIWGVLDIVPITDFPDIRMRCAIHSADSGSIMIIPREKKLVRVYVQLTTTAKVGDEAGSRADRSKINPDIIIAEAQKIMAPYQISYQTLDWWTAYQIGQRVGTQFSVHERVFLAGDAVHTHSPKAGQGMNVSMQDTFNLGWKIASVVKGQTNRSILKTYESERRKVAQDLITFDHKFSRLFSGRPAKDDTDTEGVKMEDFKDAFMKGNLFVSGTSVNYGASAIVAKAEDPSAQRDGIDALSGDERGCLISDQALAPGLVVGMRIPSVKVLSQADARPWHLQELLPSNGRWRVLVFPGNVQDQKQADRLTSVANNFDSRDSFVARFTAADGPIDAVFELLVVHKAPRSAVTIFDFPPVFRRFSDVEGYDYDKIYVDDVSYHEGHGNIYQEFGISEEGCIVVVRPDQHVSYVGSLRKPEAVTQFFSGFMVSQVK